MEKYKRERERERLAIAQRDRLVIRHRFFPHPFVFSLRFETHTPSSVSASQLAPSYLQVHFVKLWILFMIPDHKHPANNRMVSISHHPHCHFPP
jgi:hypothetical protein